MSAQYPGWKGSLGVLVQLPVWSRASCGLTQDFIQRAFETFQGWQFCSPVVSAPVWNSPHGQKVFLPLSLNLVLSVTPLFSCALPSLLEEPGSSQLPPQPWLEQSHTPSPPTPLSCCCLWGLHHTHDIFLSWGPRSRCRIQMWFPEYGWALMPSGCLNPSPVLCPGARWAVQADTNLC